MDRAVQPQIDKLDMTRIGIEVGAARLGAAVFFAMDAKAMQMGVAPGEDELQHGIGGWSGTCRRGGRPANTTALPDYA